MIDGLIRWSLRNRAVVVALAAAFLAWGGVLVARMPLDVLPDLTAPTVTVLVEGAGMDPVEMESLVTFPIESAINGAPGVRRVRSATAVGVAVIWVEFAWGEDIHRARQVVNEKLALVAASLPPAVAPPFLAPISSIMGEILFVSLESDRHGPQELRTIADTVVRRRLLAVPGVSQVIPTGGDQKQYQVALDPFRLRQYGVTLGDVERALSAGSRNASAGFLVRGGQEYLIQGIGRATTTDDLARIVVVEHATRPVRVGDLGDVRVGAALKRGEGSHNAEPAVILGIQKQPGANTLALTARVEETLDEIQRTLPAGMQIDRRIFRQADFIERALRNLRRALIEGAALVVVVVVVFLVNLRTALVTLLALPLSLVAALVGMDYFGFTINSMTLGGLAIAIGELVDDAIIDVENVTRRLRLNTRLPDGERQPSIEVVYRASTEIRGSVVFATIIVALVFVPLFMLSSVEGRLLKPLGFAYVVALFASLVVALTVTPALCSWVLPRARSVLREHDPWVVARLKRVYRPSLAWALAHPALVTGSALAACVMALGSFAFMGRAFLPEFNEGTLTISAVTLPGTSLEEADALGRGLERILLTVPEVVSTARRTGRAELDEHVQGVESAEIDVDLRMQDRPKAAILEEIRQKVRLVPGTNVTVGQPISHRIDHMLSGTRANIAVKIFGDDLAQLRALARRVQAAMAGVDGVVDLSAEPQTDIPSVRVRVAPDAASRIGLPPGAVAEFARTALVGREVGRVLEGQVSVPLVVRYGGPRPSDPDDLGRTLIEGANGVRVPLASVAAIAEDRTPNFIMREGVQRRIVVQCNVAGRDLRSVVEDVRRAVTDAVDLPPGYRIEYGGQFESEAQASRQLLWLGLAVVAGILVVLSSAFRSVRDALLIMLNLPLALIGGVIGVFLAGGVLSVASMIGFITLFGIASRNGIMLVSHIRHLRAVEGVPDLQAAVVRGAEERMAPILMTALAAGLGLIPIAAGLGKPGSEIQAPMALVILFGLLSSTALNMIVVPVMYARFGDRRTPLR